MLYNYETNVLIIGDKSVGKTSLINRMIHEKFISIYNFAHYIQISKSKITNVYGKKLKINYCEENNVEKVHLSQYHIIVIVFDLNSDKFQDNMSLIYNKLNNNYNYVIFCGTKSDKLDNIKTTIDNFYTIFPNKMCASRNIQYVLISAQTGYGVEKLYNLIVNNIFIHNLYITNNCVPVNYNTFEMDNDKIIKNKSMLNKIMTCFGFL